MNKAKVVSGLLAIFAVMPIWYYLLYKILTYAQATDLMWFLYWIYLPVGIFVNVLDKIANSD